MITVSVQLANSLTLRTTAETTVASIAELLGEAKPTQELWGLDETRITLVATQRAKHSGRALREVVVAVKDTSEQTAAEFWEKMQCLKPL